MGILAQVVEHDGALTGLQCMFRAASGQFLLAKPRQGTKGELQEPLALTAQPFVPALFADGNVVQQVASVEIDCRAQCIRAALADQSLESADIALHGRRVQGYDLAVALEGVLAEHTAQSVEGLAQVLLGLGLEVGAPQQGRQPLTRLRLRHRTGQIGQQACDLLARKVDNAIRSGQLEASQQRKIKPWGRRALCHCVRGIRTAMPFPAHWHFSRPSGKNLRPCDAGLTRATTAAAFSTGPAASNTRARNAPQRTIIMAMTEHVSSLDAVAPVETGGPFFDSIKSR